MKKLVYLFPAVIALGFAGCTDDPTGAADTEADTEEDGTTDADPTVTASDTAITSTTTGPIDPDTGSDSSTTDEPAGCDEDDACTPDTVEADCGVGFVCIGCLCAPDGDAPLCPDGWANEGAYADCGAGEECGGGDLNVACAGGPTESSVCLFQGCEETCDCPAPQEGFEDLVTCEDAFGPGGTLDGINECFLDCGGGETCPDGMFCGGGICYAGEAPPFPDYEDCLNEDLPECESTGVCLSDEETFGVCGSVGCTDASDCGEAPETGDAAPGCTDFPDGSTSFCSLTCDGAETCPDGMICLALTLGADAIGSHCLWPAAAVVEVGFDDCANNPDGVCLEGEVCVSDDVADPATGVCAQTGCVDATMDCRAVPPGGDAVAACAEIDDTSAGEECVVDCSGAEMCPTGMACTPAGYCAWEEAGFTLSEDFLPGVLPGGWLVFDVDGLPVAAQVAYVNDAWAVSDTVVPGDPAAYSTSFYDPAGTSDDWLVTPAVPLSATSVVSWDGRAPDMNFPDGYEVYVADATDLDLMDFVMTGDPTTFLAANDPVLTIAAEEADFTTRTLSAAAGEPLAGLVGSDVHVLWRNNSNNMFVLMIDNVSVTQ